MKNTERDTVYVISHFQGDEFLFARISSDQFQMSLGRELWSRVEMSLEADTFHEACEKLEQFTNCLLAGLPLLGHSELNLAIKDLVQEMAEEAKKSSTTPGILLLGHLLSGPHAVLVRNFMVALKFCVGLESAISVTFYKS